jgi:hypothetical protein
MKTTKYTLGNQSNNCRRSQEQPEETKYNNSIRQPQKIISGPVSQEENEETLFDFFQQPMFPSTGGGRGFLRCGPGPIDQGDYQDKHEPPLPPPSRLHTFAQTLYTVVH